jgi:hypothetical protein
VKLSGISPAGSFGVIRSQEVGLQQCPVHNAIHESHGKMWITQVFAPRIEIDVGNNARGILAMPRRLPCTSNWLPAATDQSNSGAVPVLTTSGDRGTLPNDIQGSELVIVTPRTT